MKKKKIMLSIMIMLGIMALPIQTKAALQANPNTNGNMKDKAVNWMPKIREMETKNQAMGLEETIDNETMKSTSGSNRIDVHMIKTTEWGAVAILSASGYGNSKKVQESELKTATGNKSGVYFPLKWEVTAGGLKEYIFTNVDTKYYDTYENNYNVTRIGDGLGIYQSSNPGCALWHDAPYQQNVYSGVNADQRYFVIRGDVSIFNFGANTVDTYWSGGTQELCRSVVVCGEGF